jgi:hypothetical protein
MDEQPAKKPACRRCAECVGEDHHWSFEYVVWADDEPEHPAAEQGLDCWLTCKHCDEWKPYPDDDNENTASTINLSCGKCGAVISVRAGDVAGYQIDATKTNDHDDPHVTCPFHYGSTYWMFATEEPL